MKPYLLKLSCGRLSLEFQDADRRALIGAIRDRYGRPEIEVAPTASICRFGGASFTFYDQWDEPCLISGSVLGDAILETLIDDLEPAPRPMLDVQEGQSLGA